MKKPKVAIFSLSSCEGCQFVLLDLGQRFFDFLKRVELIDFPLIEEKRFPKKIKLDVAFVEGVPITEENLIFLKKIRAKTKLLVALGNCATLGGIPEMKNYQGKERTIRYLYKKLDHLANPEIKEIDNFVKVDFVILGCPINGQEFLKLAKDLIGGKIPTVSQNPICLECLYRATPKCFLIRKKNCFGFITLAGCGAICPANEFACLGCRGPIKNTNLKNFFNHLKKFQTKEEIQENLEIFGLRDQLEKFL